MVRTPSRRDGEYLLVNRRVSGAKSSAHVKTRSSYPACPILLALGVTRSSHGCDSAGEWLKKSG